MLVPIADTITIVRHVALPSTCPLCHRAIERVRLIQLECTAQVASATWRGCDGLCLDDWDIPEGCGEGYTALSWRCGQCDAELVEPGEEFTVADPDVAGGAALLALASKQARQSRHQPFS